MFTILLIEDDYDDIDLLQDALGDNRIVYKMDIINEGDKVHSYLESIQNLPHIIVLDFNLPKKHGKEILKEISADGRYNHIPLIVLTTSSAKEDIEYSYKMGARHFITKPTTLAGFNKTVEIICSLVGQEQ
jgi:DNA-binding response OmpR family regulator